MTSSDTVGCQHARSQFGLNALRAVYIANMIALDTFVVRTSGGSCERR